MSEIPGGNNGAGQDHGRVSESIKSDEHVLVLSNVSVVGVIVDVLRWRNANYDAQLLGIRYTDNGPSAEEPNQRHEVAIYFAYRLDDEHQP